MPYAEQYSVNASGIFALFEHAVAHRLKYPHIRLQTPNGAMIALKRAGDRSKYPGQIMVTDGRPFGQNTYFGRIDASTFHSTNSVTPDIVALLNRLAENPAQVGSEYGKLTGNCSFCGLPLSDARSSAVGYGPICAKHFGLDWGSK